MRKNRALPPLSLAREPHAGDREIRVGTFLPAHIVKQEGRKKHVADAGCESI